MCFVLYRFDKLLYVGVAEDKESQLSIMVALTRRYVMSISVHCANFNPNKWYSLNIDQKINLVG